MADLKISQLTAISVLTPATDVLPVVDVGGVTKKITTNQILASGGVASLASATITGDLTVDTSTLKVDSTNNRVGIGTASPSQPLHVRFDNAGPTTLALFENNLVDFASSAAGQIVVGARGYLNTVLRQNPDLGTTPAIGGYQDTILANISTSGNGKVILATASTARLIVHETSGNISIANGNLVMTTSGKGIDFSAVTGGTGTATANVLNDYEEGTFTPTVVGATIAGVGVYTQQAGYYTKVGNLVTASVFLGWTAHTGTGIMYFGGLPFVTSSSANSYGAASITYVNNITLTASNVMNLLVPPAQSFLESYQYPVGGGAATNVPIDTAGSIIYTVTYRV